MNKLTPEEKAVERDLLQGKFKPVSANKWKRYRSAARKTLCKDARISLRLQQDDLDNIKKIAEEKGLPYQSLINSVLHRFAGGKMIDISDVRIISKLLSKA